MEVINLNKNQKEFKYALLFRAAEKEEISKIIDLFAASFYEDPLMSLFNPEGKNQKRFISDLFLVNTKAYFRRHLCFVATVENEIVAAALVRIKGVSEINFLDYALSGGSRLIMDLGVKRFISFLSTYDKAQEECKKLASKMWYIDTLAVNSKWQREGIGGRMLQDCIIPYIRQNAGGMLTLITQNRNNCAFYNSNGFTNFATSTLINGESRSENFSFKQIIAAE